MEQRRYAPVTLKQCERTLELFKKHYLAASRGFNVESKETAEQLDSLLELLQGAISGKTYELIIIGLYTAVSHVSDDIEELRIGTKDLGSQLIQ